MGTVLLRRSALGDVVLLGSVTASLPGPVTVVTAPAWIEIAARLRGVDRVIAWPAGASAAAVAASLPAGDRVIDLHGSLRSCAVAAWAGGAAARIDKRSVHRWLWLRGFVREGRPPVPGLYAEACGVTAAPPPWIDLPRRSRDGLVLVPGANWATKRWTADGFAEVGRSWSGPVYVVGGPDDATRCAQVVAQVPGAVAVVERGFRDTLAALASARVAVGGDTGLLHLAAAVGVPVVTLLGPTHAGDGFVVHAGGRVERELPCRPCSRTGSDRCPLGHHACLDLDPLEVAAEVARVAERSEPRDRA